MWKKANIVSLYKKKVSKQCPGNYKPVSLTRVVRKTTEMSLKKNALNIQKKITCYQKDNQGLEKENYVQQIFYFTTTLSAVVRVGRQHIDTQISKKFSKELSINGYYGNLNVKEGITRFCCNGRKPLRDTEMRTILRGE